MRFAVLAVCSAAVALAGCDGERAADGPGQHARGRYSGIAVIPAGRMWEQVKGAPKPADPAAATQADDEHVIVVIDSQTGEVRQCGDRSGFCVAMNPWSGKAPAAPAILARHLADLDAAEAAAGAETAASASSK